jgi:hypothetical protein
MPRLTDEQVRRLRELAGMTSSEASVPVLLAAVTARLAERNRQLASPARRDAVISAAIGAGKFTEARRPHYRQMWERDPVAAEATIASLTPVGSALAAATSTEAEQDAEYAHLWPPELSSRPDFRPHTAAEREHMIVGPSREQYWAQQDAAMAAAAGPMTDAEYRQLFPDEQ